MEEDNQDSGDSSIVVNGLRYILPYERCSKPLSIPDRLLGDRLDTVLGTLFRLRRGEQPLDEAARYWSTEIEAGRVEIRGPKRSRQDAWAWQIAHLQSKVEPGTQLRIRRHVHERVVPAVGPITILEETDEWLVIQKPPGVATVDENGQVSSLLRLLQHQMGTDKKYTPAHRLDQPVSGVLIMGKSPKQAARLLRSIQCQHVEKIYVARVYHEPSSRSLVHSELIPAHDFNESPCVTVEAELAWNSRLMRTLLVSDAGSVAAEKRAHHRTLTREGNQRYLDKDSKAVVKKHATEFKSLHNMDDGTLLVECRPQTGQRHQIRAHLAAIGWPIANDVAYGGTLVAAQQKPAYTSDQRLSKFLRGSHREWCPKCHWTLEMVENSKTGRDPVCVDTGGIWLHSRRYFLPSVGLDVSSRIPDWAEVPATQKNASDQSCLQSLRNVAETLASTKIG